MKSKKNINIEIGIIYEIKLFWDFLNDSRIANINLENRNNFLNSLLLKTNFLNFKIIHRSYKKLLSKHFYALLFEIAKFKFKIEVTNLEYGKIVIKNLTLYTSEKFKDLRNKIDVYIKKNTNIFDYLKENYNSLDNYWSNLVKEILKEFNDILKENNLFYESIKFSNIKEDNNLKGNLKKAIFITSFGDGHKTVYDILSKDLLTKKVELEKINISSGKTLSGEILNKLNNCNNFIVDLSFYDKNFCKENVAYELGYIRGKEKNIILIVKNKDFKEYYSKSENFSDISGEIKNIYKEPIEIIDIIEKELHTFK